MRLFSLGFITALVFLVVCGYAYISTGMVPVSTSAPPLPFERLIAHMALDARIEREAPKTAPLEPSPEVYYAGVQIYQNNCAVCHGLPGQEQSNIAKGEFPPPPKLLEGKGVTDDPPGETYWKVANGIRLTGMPGFNRTLSNDQMWQVSLLLANADKLPPHVQKALQQAPPSGPTP